jgi:thioredoxin reductase (NADPH)
MVLQSEMYDVTIVGAGPVGLYATYYAGLRDCRTKLLETYPQVGGRLISMYPEKEIFDVAGHKNILARDLIRAYQAGDAVPPDGRPEREGDGLACSRRAGDRAFDPGREPLYPDRGDRRGMRGVRSAETGHPETAVIAVGCGAFVPRKLDIPHLTDLEGHGIYYYLPSFEPLRGKKVLIVGGGNSAVDWALSLTGIASKVILVHRMYKFHAHEAMVDTLLSSEVKVKFPYFALKEVIGEDKITGAVIWNERSGKEERIEVDAIVLSIGMLTNLEPFRQWGHGHVDQHARRICGGGYRNVSREDPSHIRGRRRGRHGGQRGQGIHRRGCPREIKASKRRPPSRTLDYLPSGGGGGETPVG